MKIIDSKSEYDKLVTFEPNRNIKVHRWYPLIEGFSSELVEKIILEQETTPNLCLDLFGGIGTTALTCYQNNIDSVSIEASPFFYDVSTSKLNYRFYDSEILIALINNIEESLKSVRGGVKHPELESKTFFQSEERDKWIFHRTVSNGIFDIIKLIDNIDDEHQDYKILFKISLSTILQEISNVFKNGKCLSYKKNWEQVKYKRRDVHRLFLQHIKEVILVDIEIGKEESKGSNFTILKGDSRQIIDKLPNNIDLVITSPPYLNSRDYTDIYRLELWMLGYVKTYSSERILRKKALTSHVQIQLPKVKYPEVTMLKKAVKFLESEKAELWNKNIPNMVRGYFADMEKILIDLIPKLSENAKLYINVSNSCYSNYVIEVDKIIAKIAELNGYKCLEIRIAREIKTSSQQASKIDNTKMRESIIVLKK